MIYFAYGSNMNRQQMDQRCPNRFVKRACLKGYKFVYDGYSSNRKGAVANIIETCKENDEVWGGLFEIDKDGLSALDHFEGYPNSYQRKEVKIWDKEDICHTAIAYFRIGKQPSQPSEEYRKIIIQGAKDCNLPDEYIKNNLLKSF